MIVFFEAGRLGNQLFQYCALRRACRDGRLFLIGMKALKKTFDGVDICGSSLAGKMLGLVIRLLGSRGMEILARKFRLIGLIEECRTPAGSDMQVQEGRLKEVYYCSMSFFQAENCIDAAIAEQIRFKPHHLSKGQSISRGFPEDRTATFFVHVRRGDYMVWPSAAAPAVLPLGWYREQMDIVRSRYTKPFFIVVSDDRRYLDECFAQCPDVFVSHESEGVDLVLMAQCDGGILSASSFAWWAAYFARRRNRDGLFIAPLYWAGHREGSWYPEGVQTSWLRYAPVRG